MTAILRRRGSIVAALLIVLALAALLLTSSLRGATAAQEPEPVFWTIHINDTARASNGHINLAYDFTDFGPNPQLLNAHCGGESPRTGPNIPGQVVTQVTGVDRFALRVIHVDGRALTGTVGFNCVVGVITDAEPAVTPTGLRNKINGATIRANAVKGG